MAMITCPKCHRHISSMARACPECGAPIEPDQIEESQCKEPQMEIEEPQIEEDAQEKEVSRVDEKTQAERPVSSGKPMWLLVLVVLLGLIIGGLYYYDYRAEQRRELRAYEMLKGCSNPDFYEDFIIRFPKSEYIAEVKERLKEVSAQQIEWQNLVSSGTRNDLQRFASQHPTSPYAKVALTRIDSLDWAEAKAARSLEAVTYYMATHPDGYYIDQAETLRQTIERQRSEAAAALRDSLARADSVTATPAV